ncbi:MAG: hypothetical protein KJ720_13650 [Proteobacteria bacterium]|nr:hypothetical protein [Pseudomonadota bacterium]MBU1450482.1 hypothetical protein [Pseudomonadota bacterium]MBU2469605.1 hypothetical protein [Pseudomonadota bacterium]MBU2516676.1 hypothetical protein [Pseudomonadota bacterium]
MLRGGVGYCRRSQEIERRPARGRETYKNDLESRRISPGKQIPISYPASLLRA